MTKTEAKLFQNLLTAAKRKVQDAELKTRLDLEGSVLLNRAEISHMHEGLADAVEVLGLLLRATIEEVES